MTTSKAGHSGALPPKKASRGRQRAANGWLFRICLVLFLLSGVWLIDTLIFGRGETLVEDSGPLERGHRVNFPFTLTDRDRPIRVDIRTDIDNALFELDVVVLDAAGSAMFARRERISYHHGYKHARYFNRGSADAYVLLDLPETGSYTLSLIVPPYALFTPMASVEIRQGYVHWQRPVFIAGVFLLATIAGSPRTRSTFRWLFGKSKEAMPAAKADRPNRPDPTDIT